MSSFANTGFVDAQSTVQFQYIFIIIEISANDRLKYYPKIGFYHLIVRFLKNILLAKEGNTLSKK